MIDKISISMASILNKGTAATQVEKEIGCLTSKVPIYKTLVDLGNLLIE